MHYERAKGDPAKADAIRVFYEEYFATMDLTADFYLETVETVFQRHALPLHELEVRGRLIEPSKIRRTALLTVEGEKDDICAVGQTLAAQDMCDKLRPYLKTHHVQTGVGHYGVFNGHRWERHIYPRVRAVIYDNEPRAVAVNVHAPSNQARRTGRGRACSGTRRDGRRDGGGSRCAFYERHQGQGACAVTPQCCALKRKRLRRHTGYGTPAAARVARKRALWLRRVSASGSHALPRRERRALRTGLPRRWT